MAFAQPAARRIPLAGDNGPAFTGGSSAPVDTGAGFAWDRHPAALALIALFLVVVVFKVVR